MTDEEREAAKHEITEKLREIAGEIAIQAQKIQQLEGNHAVRVHLVVTNVFDTSSSHINVEMINIGAILGEIAKDLGIPMPDMSQLEEAVNNHSQEPTGEPVDSKQAVSELLSKLKKRQQAD